MRVLILGGARMLGTDLVASTPVGTASVALDLADVDITDRMALAAAIDRTSPDVVINAAAYTAVDRAESERARANEVNGIAPGLLGLECARRDIRVVHYLTDYVFSGTATTPYAEHDPVAPINAYGETKLLGERAVMSSGAKVRVLRTQWLFGRAGRSFPRTMWERASAGQATRVVDDQRGRPTYTVDLADATWQLIALGTLGIVHAANTGPDVTWFEFAREVFARAGAISLLSPCSTSDCPTPAPRPAFSVLSTARLESLVRRPLPTWRDALERFLREIGAPANGQRDPEKRPI
jgi:dTDP-4-dehydrorhamnose reductase